MKRAGMAGNAAVRWTMAVVVGLVLVPASAKGAEPSATADPVAQIKADFDAAMVQPLERRVALLEALAPALDRALDAASLDPAATCRVLDLKYRVLTGLAKYQEAHDAFGRYARSLKDLNPPDRARTTLMEFVRGVYQSNNLVECPALADAALASWNGDADAAPGLLFYKAQSLGQLNGRGNEAIAVLEGLIGQFPESPWRPEAMRLLANLQANGYGAGDAAALATLELIERQYKGTWWEQYAHMKPAMILEARRGEPAKALARFQETLQKFPDHAFATFCRHEIERLAKVIEEQLIQDALNNLARGPAPDCDGPGVIVRVAPAAPQSADRALSKR